MTRRTVFHDFVEDFLSLHRGSFVGFQGSFGHNKDDDLLLFNTEQGNTLSVPISILLEDRENARITIQQKIAASNGMRAA